MKKGFTLAEVLITLAVIGVVAVLTVPNMMKSYQKQVTVTQLQKFYNQLRTAATNCMQEEMSDSLEGTSAFNNTQSFVKKYLKPTSFFTDYTEGFAESYQNIDGTNKATSEFEIPSYCTGENGNESSESVCATLETGASLIVGPQDNGVISIIIDVNGKKSPNIMKRDLFGFHLNADGTVGDFYDDTSGLKTYCLDPLYDYGICFDYIKNNGWVMDY